MPFRMALVVPAILLGVLPAAGQHQQPPPQQGWPCAGTVDPAFVRMAEATGGKVMLFAPSEMAAAGSDTITWRTHDQTVFRAAGEVGDNTHEFDVPVDSTIDSLYVVASLQCLQFVTIARPSGEILSTDDPGIHDEPFTAIRRFVIKTPLPGLWKVRMAGRGFFSLIVKAHSDRALSRTVMTENGVPVTHGRVPLGQAVRLEVGLRGHPSDVTFSLVSMEGATLRRLRLVAERNESGDLIYTGDVTLPTNDFRVRAAGVDAAGAPFQRVTSTMFVGR